MPEELHTCPTCLQNGFTARGLKAHKCKGPSNPENDPNAPGEFYIQRELKRIASPHWSTYVAQASTPQLQRALQAARDEGHKGRVSSLESALRERAALHAEESAAPVGASQSEHSAVATGPLSPAKASKPAKAEPAKLIDAKLVDEALEQDTPRLIDRKGSAQLVATFDTAQLVDAIKTALAATEDHRRQSAIWDLRAGVLFHLFRESKNVRGRKYTGFWSEAEELFGVGRATISRKMRLAAIWAKEQGADEAMLQQLAAASDFTAAADNPAVAAALEWVGDATTSDLYRKNKLVAVGPQGGYRETKSDGSERAKKRTKAEIAREEFEVAATAALNKLRAAFDEIRALRGPGDERAWDLLDDTALAEVKAHAHDLHAGCIESEKRRAAAKKGAQS